MIRFEQIPYNAIREIVYHAWIIKAGSRQYLFHGSIPEFKKALEKIKSNYSPSYAVKYKKVN